MIEIEDQEFEDPGAEVFEDTVFIRCTFTGDARGVKFVDCEFNNCQLLTLKLDGAVLQASFNSCKIEGVNFFTAKRELLSLAFKDCLLRYSSFAELKLAKASFAGCEMRAVDFSDADLSGANLRRCDLAESIFNNTNLNGADLRDAVNYAIDPTINRVRKAKFSYPEAISLLAAFGIEIES